MKIDTKRAITLGAIIMVGLLPIGNVSAQAVSRPNSGVTTQAVRQVTSNTNIANSYIQTNVIGNAIYQRNVDEDTLAVSNWESTNLNPSYTPVSKVSMAKGNAADNSYGLTYLVQAVIVKDMFNNYTLLRRTYIQESNLWTPWIAENQVAVSADSKVELFYRKSGSITPMFYSFVKDKLNNIKVQVSIEPVIWSSASTAASNVKNDFSIFEGTTLTSTREKKNAIFVSYINLDNKIETSYSPHYFTWAKIAESKNSNAKSIKTVLLKNVITDFEGFGSKIVNSGFMPLQVMHGTDDFLYYRVLDCFTKTLECGFTPWKATGDRTQSDFSVIASNGLNSRFIVSLKGMDNNGYTSEYDAKIIPWSGFQLNNLGGDFTPNIDSVIYTDNLIAPSTTKSIIQTAIINGNLQHRLLSRTMNGNIMFNSGNWTETRAVSQLNLSGINLYPIGN